MWLQPFYILIIALGLGLWLWRWLGPADGRFAETALLSVGLGFGALGLVVLLVGLVGWLTRAVSPEFIASFSPLPGCPCCCHFSAQ